MFDDVIFYCTKRLPHEDRLVNSPADATLYIKQIALAHWMNTLEYIQRSVSKLEHHLEAKRAQRVEAKLGNHTSTMVESDEGVDIEKLGDIEHLLNILGVVYRLKRECSQLCDWMDTNLFYLSNSRKKTGERLGTDSEGGRDWVYVHDKLIMWTFRSRDLVSSAIGWMSLVESRTSVEESQNTRILTILGISFLPLSLPASILSMGGDFLPGRSKFWIYIVISLVLLLTASLIFILYGRIPHRGKRLRKPVGIRGWDKWAHAIYP